MGAEFHLPDRPVKLIAAHVSAILLAFLCSCTSLVQEHRANPRIPVASGDLKQAEASIAKARAIAGSEPRVAIGLYLSAAEAAAGVLDRNPEDSAAVSVYNYAVDRVFTVFNSSGLQPWLQPLTVPGYVITGRGDDRIDWEPAHYDFTPCDEIQVSGSFFPEPVRREGIGAPLLAERRDALVEYRSRFLASERPCNSATAVARFGKGKCEITLEDPFGAETTVVGRHSFPLAGDFSTAPAAYMVRDRPQGEGFARMIDPARYAERTRLFRFQPYDPKKIPVLFVHGLQNTSANWMPMFNALMKDAEIRKNYQVWFFSYPSGDPFPYSAISLREDLKAIDAAFPGHRNLVVVGHSVGGLLTRLMVTDSGLRLWKDIFGKSPEETELPAATKAILLKGLIFEHSREIDRVIFMSTPHRGSKLARGWMGRLVASLVKLPSVLVEAGSALASAPTVHGRLIPNNVQILSPKSRFILALNRIPITPGIPYHQIIGNSGGNDLQNSTDGVVAYWSSYLEGAASTKIVRCGHMSNRDPQGIAEVIRILKLHLTEVR